MKKRLGDEGKNEEKQKQPEICKHSQGCIIHALKGFGHSLKLGLYLRLFGILIQILTKGPVKVLQDIK